MKIKRSSKATIKFAIAKKLAILDEILDEYGRVANLFIDYFWEHPEFTSANQITAQISIFCFYCKVLDSG
jgi:hypothetical protein